MGLFQWRIFLKDGEFYFIFYFLEAFSFWALFDSIFFLLLLFIHPYSLYPSFLFFPPHQCIIS